jgi:hypothetical protein
MQWHSIERSGVGDESRDIYGRLPVVKRLFTDVAFLSMMAPLLAERAFRFCIVAMKKWSADIYSGSLLGMSPRFTWIDTDVSFHETAMTDDKELAG